MVFNSLSRFGDTVLKRFLLTARRQGYDAFMSDKGPSKGCIVLNWSRFNMTHKIDNSYQVFLSRLIDRNQPLYFDLELVPALIPSVNVKLSSYDLQNENLYEMYLNEMIKSVNEQIKDEIKQGESLLVVKLGCPYKIVKQSNLKMFIRFLNQFGFNVELNTRNVFNQNAKQLTHAEIGKLVCLCSKDRFVSNLAEQYRYEKLLENETMKNGFFRDRLVLDVLRLAKL